MNEAVENGEKGKVFKHSYIDWINTKLIILHHYIIS